MRPLAIWAIQYAVSPPKAILEAPKVNLMDRIHISPHMARAISEISIRKIAPDNRCFPSSAFNCECWSKGNMQLLSNLPIFSAFWFLLARFKAQWGSGVRLLNQRAYPNHHKTRDSKEFMLYNCTANCNHTVFFFHTKFCAAKVTTFHMRARNLRTGMLVSIHHNTIHFRKSSYCSFWIWI